MAVINSVCRPVVHRMRRRSPISIRRPTRDYDYRLGVLPDDHTLTRADASTCATYFDSAGVLQTAAANVARFDHNPSTGESLGLLIEGARTNLCLQSNGFDTTWTNSSSVEASAQGTSPDGTNNAWKVTDDSSSGVGSALVLQAVVITNAAYTWSIYAKADQLSILRMGTQNFTAANANSYFDLSTGTVGTTDHTSAGIQSVGNGWYRCWVVFTPGADVSGNIRFGPIEDDNDTTVDLDGTSSILVYGSQLELGSFPSAYIPTTTSSTTRAADVCTVTGLDTAGWFNGAEGSFLVDYRDVGVSGSTFILVFNGTADTDLLYSGANPDLVFRPNTGAGAGDATLISSVTAGARKVACAYEASNSAGSVNGAAVVTGSDATLPTDVSALDIGNRGGSLQAFAHYKRIAYWPQRLPNAELQALSR